MKFTKRRIRYLVQLAESQNGACSDDSISRVDCGCMVQTADTGQRAPLEPFQRYGLSSIWSARALSTVVLACAGPAWCRLPRAVDARAGLASSCVRDTSCSCTAGFRTRSLVYSHGQLRCSTCAGIWVRTCVGASGSLSPLRRRRGIVPSRPGWLACSYEAG